MSDRLSAAQVALLCLYALGMAGGQLLFKFAALRAGGAGLMERLPQLLQNGFFLAALALYFALSVVWVWILGFTPLSRAYPFVALAFAITPLLGALVFAEPISARLVGGIAVILLGLMLVGG
jgi:drug/metabolite transporter (DMT)-like permease